MSHGDRDRAPATSRWWCRSNGWARVSCAAAAGADPNRRVHSRAVREHSWRDLSLRQAPLVLRYRPHRVRCSRYGVRVEALPWAEPWARVTKALAGAPSRHALHLRHGIHQTVIVPSLKLKRANKISRPSDLHVEVAVTAGGKDRRGRLSICRWFGQAIEQGSHGAALYH